MYGTVFWTLWEKERVGCFKRTASKHVYYLGWTRSPAQVGCMRQVLGPGALRRPRGIGWRGRWEGGSGWGTHVNPWLIHFNVWQNPLQKKKKKKKCRHYAKVKVTHLCPTLCDLMDYAVHGILQARIMDWVAFPTPFPGIFQSFQPRDRTQVSLIAGGFFSSWATGKSIYDLII